MNLTQLRYFQAVCQRGSITSAVEELNISQPSVSAAMKALEDEFGVPLFERQRRGMAPTQEGKRLLLLADSLLEHARQVEETMADVSHQRRSLRIGVTPLVGSLIIPQLYTTFFQHNPDIRFHIREMAQDELLAQLMGDRQDVVILPHISPVEEGLKAITISDLRMSCYLPAGHPLAHRQALTASDLKDEPLVLFQSTSIQSQAIRSAFSRQGLVPNVLLYTEQLVTMEQFVAQKLAVAFLYSGFIYPSETVVEVPLEPPITTRVSVVYKKDAYRFEEMDDFLRFCRKHQFHKNH